MLIHRRLLALTASVRGWLALLVILGLLIAATFIGQGVLTAWVIGLIFAGESRQAAAPLMLAILALVIVRAALQWFEGVGAKMMAVAIKERLRTRLYAHLLDLGVGYLVRERTGAVQATLVDGVQHLEGYLTRYIPQCFVALIAPVPIIAFLYLVDPLIAIVVVACMALIPIAPAAYSRLLGRYGQSHWEAYSALNARFLDALQGMITLKAFNASERHGRQLNEEAWRLYRATMLQLMISLVGTGFIGLLTGAGTSAAIGIGSVTLAGGAATMADLLLILLLVGECFRPLLLLDRYWHIGYLGIAASNAIHRLLDAQPEVRSPASAIRAIPGVTRPAVRFQHVFFGYNAGERPALVDLSFSIDPGERVALVGRSGAGKSTVVALLLRFFDPQRGIITLDGRDLREYDLESLRRMVAVVSQDTYLFYGTIADNLRLARPGATQVELEAAAQAANIHAFITGLPQGYETIVGERGMRLSGGERQRIAIARALLKDAPILILDEATSSVDAANEALIQDALERLTAGRTTLIIAHRLSTVVHADRIIVLEAGRVVESGTHDELTTYQGTYAQLVAAQASSFSLHE